MFFFFPTIRSRKSKRLIWLVQEKFESCNTVSRNFGPQEFRGPILSPRLGG